MKKLFLFSLAACLSAVVSAQKVYFLYLQSEDQSPFYVRLGDKVHSSSSAGYVILPNLTDSTYYLNVGFAGSQQAETKFAVTINQNDKGFLLKNFAEGLGLFDLQDLSVLKPATVSKDNTVYQTKTDKFSSLLSKAADDPSLLKVPVKPKEEVVQNNKEEKTVSKPKEEEKKEVQDVVKVEVVPTKTTDSVETAKAGQKQEEVEQKEASKTADLPTTKQAVDVVQVPAKEETVSQSAQQVNYKPSTIIRRSESSTTEGFGLVYVDKQGDRADTIRLLIPPSKVKITDAPNNAVPVGEQMKFITIDAVVEEKKEEVDNAANQKQAPEQKQPSGMTDNADACIKTATEKDFLKLRKKMVAKENDEAMIEEARKEFKNKCFSTEQIRYLGSLFLTSAARYQFFDAAYGHVSDKASFSSLQSEIKDEYYLKRFKALIGE